MYKGRNALVALGNVKSVPTSILEQVLLPDVGSIKFKLIRIGHGLDYKYQYMSNVDSKLYEVYCSEYGYLHRRDDSTDETIRINHALHQHVKLLSTIHWSEQFVEKLCCIRN